MSRQRRGRGGMNDNEPPNTRGRLPTRFWVLYAASIAWVGGFTWWWVS